MSEIAHRGPTPASIARFAEKVAPPLRSMVDSAYPLPVQTMPKTDIVLIYVGGDTPHPWTNAEIHAMPARFRFPCWVRSDPQDVSAGQDAALFAAWLHGHGVPMGTCVILDLETAVNARYVTAFNLALRAAGFKTVKYGSQSTIWQNPQTDGGTYLALPGSATLTGEGDEVARQYAFDGAYDLSVVKAQALLPLWDVSPVPSPAGNPVLREGATGGWVIDLQNLLRAHGSAVAVDGVFGPKTLAAVKAFQSASKLVPDGIVGPLTWAALLK